MYEIKKTKKHSCLVLNLLGQHVLAKCWCLTLARICACVLAHVCMYVCMYALTLCLHSSAVFIHVNEHIFCSCLSNIHILLYPACSHIEGCQTWVCALIVFGSLVHTHRPTHPPVYGYQAEPLISFHSDTWFPWEACDTTREQKGTWTQPSAYLQHTPLLIKDN